MSWRFTVLASGSRGNASLLEAGAFGLLLDGGLGPRQLAGRLTTIGASWNRVQALILTHTHADHWNDRTLAQLHRRGLTLYCHPTHHALLCRSSPAFGALQAANQVRFYEANEDLVLAPGLRCRPLAVRHDSGATFGFRFEGTGDLFGGQALAYLADLGCWDETLADALADVDLLALEFNHDVALERASGRSPHLIGRVLGDEGHLSNEQAAALLREVLRRSPPDRLRDLVLLHLSQDCNRPHLAEDAAQAVLQEMSRAIRVHAASQDRPCPTLQVGLLALPSRRGRRGSHRVRRHSSPGGLRQCWLPGLEPMELPVPEVLNQPA